MVEPIMSIEFLLECKCIFLHLTDAEIMYRLAKSRGDPEKWELTWQSYGEWQTDDEVCRESAIYILRNAHAIFPQITLDVTGMTH